MAFPSRRLRRLRVTPGMRRLVQDTKIDAGDFVCPIFVQDGLRTRAKLDSIAGIERLPLDDVNDEVGTVADLGIPAVMLFGIPDGKNDAGTPAFKQDGVVQKAISQIKQNFGDNIVVMSDVCLCQYTTHGHCGIVNGNTISNDESVKTLAKIATSQAEAGSDVVSPSAMMDGQVAAIRAALDKEGFTDVAIMSHSAKHSSSFYSPFRDAVECAPQFGDRKTYQVPFTNSRESMMEVESDINEGVDIVMIKPALAYLDLIAKARQRWDVPVAAYSVSGEYALVKAAAMQGWINESDIIPEILYSIKRAGADMIVTYFAKSAARLFQK